MVSKTRLFDAFGELIYAVAISDGMVQQEEIDSLHKILRGHPWAKEIQWSFDYEHRKQNALMETYNKALDTFKEYGPTKEYAYLIEVLEEVAAASDGVEKKEGILISNFQKSLRAHFVEFLDTNQLRKEDH
ncbi:MAG: TerB family tellurite resistance protein [Bacteroidota bacterium]